MDGISKKIYLELQAPTEDDNRSDQRRIQDGLKEQGIEAKVSLRYCENYIRCAKRQSGK